MPTAADIVLNDSVPAAHTFEPQSITPESSILVDRDSVTPAGFKSLHLGLSPARPGRPTTRSKVRVNMPIETTENGVTTVAYTLRHDGNTVIPEQATAQQRADFAALVENAYANSVIKGYVTDHDPVY